MWIQPSMKELLERNKKTINDDEIEILRTIETLKKKACYCYVTWTSKLRDPMYVLLRRSFLFQMKGTLTAMPNS